MSWRRGMFGVGARPDRLVPLIGSLAVPPPS